MQVIHDTLNNTKRVISPDYNYRFDMTTGEFIRWGKTLDDDPVCGPVEILDLEISETCNGIPKRGTLMPVPCSACYKTNTKVGRNMSFDTFKNIFDKMPKTLTQIAFGIGDLGANKDFPAMLKYCKSNDVIPNLTINGWLLTDEWTEFLADTLGGIAVSRYENFDVCYDAVKKLTDAGIKQTNIHQILSQESLNDCYQVIDDAVSDPRLANLKAVVFLTLKPKGKRNKWNTLKDVNEYRKLIEYAFEKKVGIGFDSCSAKMFLVAMKDHPNFEQFCQLAESCESVLFSSYISVTGEFFPCSFTEGEGEWVTGIDVVAAKDWNEVWNHPKVEKFRQANIDTTDTRVCGDCRECVTFPELHDPKIRKNYIPIEEIQHG